MKPFKTHKLSTTMLAGLLMTSAGIGGAPAWAQSGAAPAAEADDGAIIVTARKKQEDLLEVPIAVSVFTGEELEKRGLLSVTDIAGSSPGININSNSSGRNDRSFQSIIIRGFTPGTINLPTSSLFIDGVPVASTTAIETINNPARVEILKGPQSAYYGRSVFAGAINVVTKLPSDHLEGSISGMAGTRNSYDVGLNLSGPLIGEKLGFTASIRKFARDGSYKNSANPGQTLGDQSSLNASLGLVAKPTENLTIKLLGMYLQDNDGPSADGLISAIEVKDSTGKVIVPNQSNCSLLGANGRSNATFCGVTPKLASGFPQANTLEDAAILNSLANPINRVVNPQDGVQGYGLKRGAYHGHIVIDYEIPGTEISLSSLTGYNNEYFSELDDLDNYNGSTLLLAAPAAGRTYYDFPFAIERTNRDFSQEFRLESGQKQAFRWAVGASYLWNRVQSDGGGGNPTLFTTAVGSPGGKNVTKTKGAFFGLSYDLTSKLTVDVEGRYQIDKIEAYAGATARAPYINPDTGAVVAPYGFLVSREYKNFLPRVIAKYQFTPNIMMYASYSKGVNPAQFNTSIFSIPAANLSAATDAGIGIVVKPEKVTNYEVGLKGKLFGGKTRWSLSGYYAKWKDQINSTSINVIIPGPPGVILISGLTNLGSSTLKGIEFDSSTKIFDKIDLDVAASVNDTHIDSFSAYPISQFTGVTNFKGNELPNTSKYSANIGLQYSDTFNQSGDASWFMRGDFNYKSGMWSNVANIVKTPPIKIVNVRAGVTIGAFGLEVFVTNLFNNTAYTTVADNFLFVPSGAGFAYNTALNVGLPNLRTGGVKAKFTF